MIKSGSGMVTYEVTGKMKSSLAITANEGVVEEDEWAATKKKLGLG